MSEIARQHIRQAVKAHLEEDGASDLGAYTDCVTEVLHLARKKFKKTQSLDMLYHWICSEGYDMFREELIEAEIEKLRQIPKKKLPLHSVNDFEFNDVKVMFEKRLKGDSI